MDLKNAQLAASIIVKKLSPLCTKLDIGGSISRECDKVKDIEIVLRPKVIAVSGNNLFEEGEEVLQVSEEFKRVLASFGKRNRGRSTGKNVKIEHYGPSGPINLDIYIPDEHDYFRQLAIRTGSAEFVRRYIASGWRKIGWCGSDKGLRKIEDCRGEKTTQNTIKWFCINPNAELPPVWTSEKEFFNWLGLKWIEPKRRNL